VDLERGERIALLLFGAVLALASLLLLTVHALPLVIRVVLALPPVTVGLSCCWAATLGWEEVGSGRRHERPEELLSVERLFLLPLVVLGLVGLVAIVADTDLEFGIRLTLLVSTLTIVLVVGGLVLGRLRIPARNLGRRSERPPPPPR
jgi:hypothetical protein